MKKIFLIALIAIVILRCTPSHNSSTNVETKTNSQTEQKAISAYAPINGLKMYYEVHGEGRPLVLIHGGGSTIETTFGRVLPLLAKNHRVVAIEIQAHGHTADIDRPLSFAQDADDVAELLKYLHIPKADVFGFSNGASTTLHFAIRHPELCNKIIVASTFYKKAGAPDWFWDMMAKPRFETMPNAYKEAFLKINPDSTALYRMYERDVARMHAFAELSEEQVKSITAPALILLGDRDVVTAQHAAEMHQLMQGSRLVILPSGHGDYIGEISQPQDSLLISGCLNIIENFLTAPLPRRN